MRLETTGQRGQTRAGDTGGALRGDQQEQQQRDLLGHRHRRAHGVGDEQGRHGHVDHGAVEVEGVAGRDGDADHRLADAEVLHLRDETRQRGLGGGRRKDQQELTAQVLEEREDVQARHEPQQRAEHDEDEEEAGDVETEHQDGELLERVQSGGPGDGGDGTERADRGGPHHHAEDAEDEALDVLDPAQDRLPGRAHGLQREAGEQGDEQGLQDRLRGEGGDDRGRDDAEQELGGVLGLGVDLRVPGVLDGVGDGEPGARLQDVADDKADAQRDQRHRQEVGHRDTADGADLGGLPYRADAQHDRAEDDRRDHHLDQVHEARSDGLQLHREAGRGQTHGDTEGDRDDHRDVEVVRAVPLGDGCGRCRIGGTGGGHGCPP